MLRVVVMLFRLNTRVREVIYIHVHAHLSRGALNHPRQLKHRKLLGELIVHSALAGIGWIKTSQLDTSNGVADIQKPSRLPAFSINRQRMAGHSLHAEPVQNRAEN